MLDLTGVYADAVVELPTEEDEDVVLTGEVLGTPPEELETGAVAIRAHPDGHIYHPATKRDLIDVFADKPT